MKKMVALEGTMLPAEKKIVPLPALLTIPTDIPAGTSQLEAETMGAVVLTLGVNALASGASTGTEDRMSL
ncbi:hypothetical protein [Sodalis ligni]|uniref:hypothetical protein n=1 Tax=Sodalis ligni TaxID=2697027 RepID=UPI00104E94F2|nr:hypothetical protein [Sodalis ligni]